MSKKMVSYPLDWGIWCFKEAAHFLLTSSFCFSLIFSINLETLLYQIIKHVSMSGNNCLLRCYKEGAGGGQNRLYKMLLCEKCLVYAFGRNYAKIMKKQQIYAPSNHSRRILKLTKKALFLHFFYIFFIL